MDVPLAIKQRLQELRLEQRELAAAARVTESYISQLLNRKKLPPAPDRTDIYERLEKILKFPAGELSRLAAIQHKEALRRELEEAPVPVLREVREMILRKCSTQRAGAVRAIFERQPLGELERLVTQKLLDAVKNVVQEELDNDNWVHLVARLSGRSYEQMRVILLEFLDSDVFSVSVENCVSFLEPMVESWDIDLGTFAMEVMLTRRFTPEYLKRFEFVETDPAAAEEEPGFKQFLRDPALRADATEEEIAFLKKLRFRGKHPTALYYYRELQNLRDPLHFPQAKKVEAGPSQTGREQSVAPMHKHREAAGIEKQMKLETRTAATHRWKTSAPGSSKRKRNKK